MGRMWRTAAICAGLLACLLCAWGGRGGDISGAVIDYGESELYTAEDLEAAAEAVLREFADFDGCVLHTLEYAGDDAGARELEYANSLSEDGDFAQCIVFTSSFRSPANGGGAWDRDREYKGWSWLLAREDGGDWEFLTGGYA